jgi:prepilin-type processing-associated H-X9-DG protein
MIRKPAEFIMIAEAGDTNWHDQATLSQKYPTTCFLRRLGARHGKITSDGANAFTNFAFFDGHVGLYPTDQFEKDPNKNDNNTPNFYSETIFFLNKQK